MQMLLAAQTGSVHSMAVQLLELSLFSGEMQYFLLWHGPFCLSTNTATNLEVSGRRRKKTVSIVNQISFCHMIGMRAAETYAGIPRSFSQRHPHSSLHAPYGAPNPKINHPKFLLR
jgi:hypothetical protein